MTDLRESQKLADWPVAGDEMRPRLFGPFDLDRLAGYAAVSGDDNPLHLDQAVAIAAGLAAPPVHGMLMLSCFEPALMDWRRDIRVAKLSGKFLRPVLAGESISVSGRVVRSNREGRPELVMRLMARGPGRDLAILAEATLVQNGARGL
jgi:acyl dehydratase